MAHVCSCSPHIPFCGECPSPQCLLSLRRRTGALLLCMTVSPGPSSFGASRSPVSELTSTAPFCSAPLPFARPPTARPQRALVGHFRCGRKVHRCCQGCGQHCAGPRRLEGAERPRLWGRAHQGSRCPHSLGQASLISRLTLLHSTSANWTRSVCKLLVFRLNLPTDTHRIQNSFH